MGRTCDTIYRSVSIVDRTPLLRQAQGENLDDQETKNRFAIFTANGVAAAGGSVTVQPGAFGLFQGRCVTSVSIPYWSLDKISDQDLAMLSNLNEIVVLEFQCRFPENKDPPSAFAKMLSGSTAMTSEALSVSPDAVELLEKIRDRGVPISYDEIFMGHPKVRAQRPPNSSTAAGGR